LHILSDLSVWLAYMAIPAVLGAFVARRKDVPFRRIFLLFTAFILACGTTHLMEAVIFWWPAYRLAAALKLATAAISWVTVAALVGVAPRVLALRAPEEFEREIAARRAAEAELVETNAALERRVRERTEELTRANAALHTERERFRTTLSSIGDAVIATDLAGRVTFLNPVAEAQTGWSAPSAVGQNLQTVFHIVNESTRAAVENPAVRALREGTVVGLANHTVLIARDGSERPIDDSAAPIRDSTGGVAGAVLVFRDITERRQAENQLRESEGRYRLLFEANPHPMWVYDRETLGFLAVNDAAIAKYGYTRTEFLGLTLKDIRPPEDVPALLASIAADTGGLDEAGVWRHRLKGGRVISVRIVSHTLTFDGREAEVVLAQDVTDQLRAEAALRHSEERFRAFMDHSPAAAWITDPDGRVVYHSASYRRTFRLPAGDIVGRAVEDLYPPDLAAAYLRTTRAVAAGRTALTAAVSGVRADGSPGEFLVYKFPLPGPDGRAQVGGVAVDVTEARAAEAALRASEERLLLALSAGNMGTFDWDIPSGRIVWSRTHYELFGYDGATPFPVEYHHFIDRVHPADRPAVEAAMGAARRTRSLYTYEYRVRSFEGTELWVADTGRFSYGPDGAAVRMLGVVQDVTARKAAELALRENEQLLRQVIDTDPNYIVLKDREGRFTLANRAMADAYGTTPEEMVGRTDADFHPVPSEVAAYRAADRAVLDTGTEYHNPEEPFTTAAGRRRWLRTTKRPLIGADGRPDAVLLVSVDVTAQKRLEDQVRQAQKLEAVGQLAGGVAHDFNNLLTVVNGCGELLLTDMAADAAPRPLVEDIVRAGQRGAALTRQLLAFSRQQMLRVEVFDPNRVLEETARLLTRLLGEDVTVRTVLDPAAGFVKADIGQVEQVVINLAVNARDAMPRGGTLVIETAPVDVTAADLPASPDARAGRYVRLTVTDTGTGMTPEVQAHLFEPFFTTKPAGKGTGLGLATVYGIVRQSGGFLAVRTEVGKGTAIAVHLPHHEPELVGPKSTLRPKPRAIGHETILVVEDEETVRALTTAVLLRQGYRVEAAESGAEALALCARLQTPPDLVLTDVVMPGMSGRELAEALTAKFPQLKVVFLSGYTADAVLRHGVEEERVAFLQKPYTPDTLARFVREVLDGPIGPA